MNTNAFDNDGTSSEVSDIEISSKPLIRNENIPKTLSSKQVTNNEEVRLIALVISIV